MLRMFREVGCAEMLGTDYVCGQRTHTLAQAYARGFDGKVQLDAPIPDTFAKTHTFRGGRVEICGVTLPEKGPFSEKN